MSVKNVKPRTLSWAGWVEGEEFLGMLKIVDGKKVTFYNVFRREVKSKQSRGAESYRFYKIGSPKYSAIYDVYLFGPARTCTCVGATYSGKNECRHVAAIQLLRKNGRV